MSTQTQQKHMRKLAALSRRDLGYIYPEDGDGGRPEGDKKVWLNTGKTFLRALAKDLGLTEFKVSANPGGIAVNGESTLIGMWEPGKGIYIQLCQDMGGMCGCVLYRTVKHMKDYSGGFNQWVSSSGFERCSYSNFVETMKSIQRLAA